MVTTLTSAFAGRMLPSPPPGEVDWFSPPAPKLLPPDASMFSDPPNTVVKPLPAPSEHAALMLSCTVRPGRESRVPTFVMSTFAGHVPRETDARIVSPLRLSELGGSSPTPGLTGDSVACTGFPGCVPWKPV
jgi:hypothetical protein